MAKKSAILAMIQEGGEDAKTIEAARTIARYFGRALCFTIMAARLPAGASTEDELIEAADDAWVALADKIILLAMED